MQCKWWLNIVFIFLALLLLSACASKPTKFYVLNAVKSPAPSRTHHRKIALGIAAVDLPHYLDKDQIITRTTANQLDVDDFREWAEPLKDNISHVLETNLTAFTNALVIRYPYDDRPVNYQVKVKVLEFDTYANGLSRLSAEWQILNATGSKIIRHKTSTFATHTDPKDYDAIVKAMNYNLYRLTRVIATAFNQIA